MMRWILAALLLTGVAVAQPVPPRGGGGGGEDDGRVVGGEDAPAGSAPFQAEIYWTISYTPAQLAEDRALPDGDKDKAYLDARQPWEQAHGCGGAVIAPGWVLTAAHCLNSANHPFLTSRRVRLGTQDLTRGGATYRIDRAAIHANWTKEGKRDDIALLHIVADAQTTKIDPQRIQPIRILGTLPDDRPLERADEVSMTGWGLTQVQDAGGSALGPDKTVNHGSAVLQVLTPLYVLDKKQCAPIPRYADKLFPTTLCVGARQAGKDSCAGDSGGPLTRVQGEKKVLVGLVSWGVGCGLKGVPGIYTNTAGYLDWIERAKQVPVGKVTPVG
jgi:secreted trypsin-like serine protease